MRVERGRALVSKVALFAALVVASVSMARSARAAGVVKCIGEQSTFTGHYAANLQWPALLGTALGAGYTVTNDGDNGASLLSPAAGGIHPYTGSAKYPDSKTPPVDYVVIGPWGMHDQIAIMAGDMAANFQADYDALVSVYLGLTPKPKVIVMTGFVKPTDAGAGFATYQNDAATLALVANTINPAVKAVAAKYNLPVIDLQTLLTTTTYLAGDGGLTNPAGQTKVSQLVLPYIMGGDAGTGGSGASSGTATSGTATSGTATSGTATSGTATSGTATSGTATSGTATSGTATSGTATSGTATSGTSAAGSTTSGATSGAGAGSTTAGASASGSVISSGTASAGTPAGSGVNGTTSGTTTTGGGTPNNSSGCSIGAAGRSGGAVGLLSLLGLAVLAARKRSRRQN